MAEKLQSDGFYDKFRAIFAIPPQQTVDVDLVGQYYDTLNCDVYQQIPWQSNLTYEFYMQMNFVYNIRNLYQFNQGTELLKLLNGNMLRNIRDAILNPNGVKLTIFSASDGNVNALN